MGGGIGTEQGGNTFGHTDFCRGASVLNHWYLLELLTLGALRAGSTAVGLPTAVFSHKPGFNVQVTGKY